MRAVYCTSFVTMPVHSVKVLLIYCCVNSRISTNLISINSPTHSRALNAIHAQTMFLKNTLSLLSVSHTIAFFKCFNGLLLYLFDLYLMSDCLIVNCISLSYPKQTWPVTLLGNGHQVYALHRVY